MKSARTKRKAHKTLASPSSHETVDNFDSQIMPFHFRQSAGLCIDLVSVPRRDLPISDYLPKRKTKENR